MKKIKNRQKKIKRLDDRNLLGLSHTVQGRAADSLASAMKNLELDKRDMAMVHLIDVFDYLMEYKNTNHEIWKRYRKRKKECWKKSKIIKQFKIEPTMTDDELEQGMTSILTSESIEKGDKDE